MLTKKGGGLLLSNGNSISIGQMTNNRLKSTNRRYLCLIISFIILLSVSFIFIAWNLLCDIDNTDSSLKLEEELETNNSESGLNLPSGSTRKVRRHSVEIFYEVLCPDSKYFILNQLIPAYKKFSKYIQPILIPYGKAFTRKTSDEKLSFECQHGQIECDGNMLHACAIHHISNEHLLISYVYCLMKSTSWNIKELERIGEKCANEYQVSWSTLKTCWKSENGPLLLKSHGESTNALQPGITFIPTIAVDQSQSYQKDILKDFKTYLCKRVLSKEEPSVCS